MKTYTKESLVKALVNIRNRGWIKSGRKGNDGGVGNTLEDLLGIEENNLPIPNAAEWELKARKKNSTSLVTLFHMEPSPRAYKFVSSILLPEYGWSHTKAGNGYPDNEMSFRQTINAKAFSNRGFSIEVDAADRKVLVRFDPSKIDSNEHPEWYEQVKEKDLNPQPYWGFQDLHHKAGTKLHNCFFVQATTKRKDGEIYFQYEDIYMLKELDLDKFIYAVKDGLIYIDFDARTGHNHGTKFRLRRESFTSLYAYVHKF